MFRPNRPPQLNGSKVKVEVRNKTCREIEIDGERYQVEVVEIPFREGVELRCQCGEELLTVSDRGLGEHEAFRLLEEQIRENSPTKP